MRVIWQFTKKQFKEGWFKTLVNTHNMQITDGTIPGLYLRCYADTLKKYLMKNSKQHKKIIEIRLDFFPVLCDTIPRKNVKIKGP